MRGEKREGDASPSVRSSIAVISMGACCGTLQQGDGRFDALSSDLKKIVLYDFLNISILVVS